MLPTKHNESGITVTSPANLKALLQRRQERNETVSTTPRTTGFQGVFTFDVTGSMFGYFDTCRENIADISNEIHKRNPLSEFSIGYFRNHGDEHHGAIYSLTPFLKDEREISRQIKGIRKGGGGSDARCCVEECLKEASRLTWDKNSAKALIIIADQLPNGVRGVTRRCENEIDWSAEVEKLQSKQIKIYPIFAGDDDSVKDFYQKIADRTGGRLLPISDIRLVTDMLVAIAMKETGNLIEYIREREKTGKISLVQKQTLLLLEGSEGGGYV